MFGEKTRQALAEQLDGVSQTVRAILTLCAVAIALCITTLAALIVGGK